MGESTTDFGPNHHFKNTNSVFDLCFETNSNLKQKGEKTMRNNALSSNKALRCFGLLLQTDVVIGFVPLGSGDQKKVVHNFHIKLFSFNDKKAGKKCL